MTNRLAEAIRAAALEEIKTVGPETVEQVFRFPAEFPGFAGHFPGYAILPAMVQMLAARCLAEDHLKVSLGLAGVENAKFLQQLHPDEEVAVQCRVHRRNGQLLCDGRLRRGAELAAAFTLVLAEGERR